MKIYIGKVVQIVESGDALLQFPKNLIQELNWRVGDKLQIEFGDGEVHMQNLSKTLRTILPTTMKTGDKTVE